MNIKTNSILETMVAASVKKRVAMLSRVSTGKWSVADISVPQRSMDEILSGHTAARGAGAAVYFEVCGEHPFTSMVLFRQEDIDIISRSFLGFSILKLQLFNQAQELLLSELGNVVINAFNGALSNILGRGFLPSAPKCVRGVPRELIEALWTALKPGQVHNVVTVALELRCGKDMTHSEVIALIPKSLEQALDTAAEKNYGIMIVKEPEPRRGRNE